MKYPFSVEKIVSASTIRRKILTIVEIRAVDTCLTCNENSAHKIAQKMPKT